MVLMKGLKLAPTKFAQKVVDGNAQMNLAAWIYCSFVMEEREDVRMGVTSLMKHVPRMFASIPVDGSAQERTNASIHGLSVMERQTVKPEEMKVHICALMSFVRAHFLGASTEDGNAQMKQNA